MPNKINTATGWHRPLAAPIKLRDGHVIETLAQAAGLMTQRLPETRQLKPIWQRAAALLMEDTREWLPKGSAARNRAASPRLGCRRLGGLMRRAF
jgi:hypothetical protein